MPVHHTAQERDVRTRARRPPPREPEAASPVVSPGAVPVDRNLIDGSAPASEAQVAALQRGVGNRVTARLIDGAGRSQVQRHGPGAPLLGGLATAASDDGVAQSKPMPAPGEGAVNEVGETTPAVTGLPPVGAGSEAPPVTAPAAATPGTAAADAGTATADAGPTPVTLTMPTLQTAFAQTSIQTAFGGFAPKPIITGNITVVASETALYEVYDKWMIDHSRTNAATGVAWVAGDKGRANAASGTRTMAFAEPAPSTNIFIDATQTDPTATVHEMLHVNTSAGFKAAVSRAINEGVTQRLAVEAVLATGNAVTGSEDTYQQEQRVVTALVAVVGENTIKQAYFQDSKALTETYEAMMGEDTWAILKATVEVDTTAGYDAAVAMLVPPSATQKIASINAILDGLYVSENDIDIIGRIVATCSESEKFDIWTEISPRVNELWSADRRARLSAILGIGPWAGPDEFTPGDTQLA